MFAIIEIIYKVQAKFQKINGWRAIYIYGQLFFRPYKWRNRYFRTFYTLFTVLYFFIKIYIKRHSLLMLFWCILHHTIKLFYKNIIYEFINLVNYETNFISQNIKKNINYNMLIKVFYRLLNIIDILLVIQCFWVILGSEIRI